MNQRLDFDKIYDLIKQSNKPISEIESECKVSAGYLSRLKNGSAEPSFIFVLSLANILDVSVYDILPDSNGCIGERNPIIESKEREWLTLLQKIFGKETLMTYCKCEAFKYLYLSEDEHDIKYLKKCNWYAKKCVALEGESE